MHAWMDSAHNARYSMLHCSSTSLYEISWYLQNWLPCLRKENGGRIHLLEVIDMTENHKIWAEIPNLGVDSIMHIKWGRF
jgi:hypothetical protein